MTLNELLRFSYILDSFLLYWDFIKILMAFSLCCFPIAWALAFSVYEVCNIFQITQFATYAGSTVNFIDNPLKSCIPSCPLISVNVVIYLYFFLKFHTLKYMMFSIHFIKTYTQNCCYVLQPSKLKQFVLYPVFHLAYSEFW